MPKRMTCESWRIRQLLGKLRGLADGDTMFSLRFSLEYDDNGHDGEQVDDWIGLHDERDHSAHGQDG